MADASRCPACRAKVHPFAAGCPSCGADLDAYRRRAAPASRRGLRLQAPSAEHGLSDLLVAVLVMLLLALYAPLPGALLAFFVLWHSHHNGLLGRRNAAAVCAALALLNLFDPNLIGPHRI